MTTDRAIGRRDEGALASVRQRLAPIPRWGWALLGILAITLVVHGWRAAFPLYIRGDLLYHWGLTHTMLLGSFPPEGPYAGLPAYYPPGFHLLLAGFSALPGLDVPSSTMLLGMLWLPVIPLGAFLLARRVAGRADVGLIAAALTAFAGGLDVSNDRLWVNSMSMSGHVAYPVYPRDLVFGLLPFAMLAFLRALDAGPRWLAWAALSGLLLGAGGLVQVQLLLPIPFALMAVALPIVWRDRARARVVLGSLVTTGLIALALVLLWFQSVAAVIARNGGVSIESSEDLLPVRIGFWGYPIQFGLVLPLAIAGAGVALLFLRRSAVAGDGASPPPSGGPGDARGPARTSPDGLSARWAPRPVQTGLLLIAWWVLPFALAVAYQPTWPLEDALRPQRMWLLASQPGLILAAIGLVALVEGLAARRPWTERWGPALVIAAVLVASLPATAATARLMTILWTEPQYAHLALDRDRVPDMGSLLDVRAPRPTVLTYEDWSSLVWYHTGASVVAVEPPGYAKLAFDPERFTGISQAQRRIDLATALAGNLSALVAVADRYDVDRIVLARRSEAVGLIGQPASLAAALGAVDGPSLVTQANGWDLLVLEPGSTLTLPVTEAGGPIELELRAGTEGALGADGLRSPGRLQVRAGDAPAIDLDVPALRDAELSVVGASIDRAAGDPIVIAAIDRIILQGVTGFVPDPGPPVGWFVDRMTPDAVVWRRVP